MTSCLHLGRYSTLLPRSPILGPILGTVTRLNRFTVSKTFYTSRMQLKVSEGQDTSKVIAETTVLLGKGWALDDEEMGIKRTFYFKTYTKALVRSVF